MVEQYLGFPAQFLDLWQMPSGYSKLHGEEKAVVEAGIREAGERFCRGVKRTLSGRWKRMTMKKPDKIYTIPEHLRYQLKNMYVY